MRHATGAHGGGGADKAGADGVLVCDGDGGARLATEAEIAAAQELKDKKEGDDQDDKQKKQDDDKKEGDSEKKDDDKTDEHGQPSVHQSGRSTKTKADVHQPSTEQRMAAQTGAGAPKPNGAISTSAYTAIAISTLAAFIAY